jgi:hypothetical protein
MVAGDALAVLVLVAPPAVEVPIVTVPPPSPLIVGCPTKLPVAPVEVILTPAV